MATLSHRYAQAALTPESSACSHVVVQWEMDIIFAYGNGLLYVLLDSYIYYILITTPGAFVGALIFGMYAVYPNPPHDATDHP
jgi:hypothetical protein